MSCMATHAGHFYKALQVKLLCETDKVLVLSHNNLYTLRLELSIVPSAVTWFGLLHWYRNFLRLEISAILLTVNVGKLERHGLHFKSDIFRSIIKGSVF